MEKEFGTETFEILRVSPSSGFRARTWKTLISVAVETARTPPSVLSDAEVMLASPLIKIFETNLRFRTVRCPSKSSFSGGR